MAHKTGSVERRREPTPASCYLDGGPVALCVLTNDNADRAWTADNAGNVLCADVAKEVYDHFARNPPQQFTAKQARQTGNDILARRLSR